MTLRGIACFGALFGLSVLPSPQREVLDEATFEFYRGATLVGREQYVVERVRGSGRSATVAVSFRSTFPADRPRLVVTGIAQFLPDSQLATVQIDAQGEQQLRTLVSVGRRQLTLRMVTPGGESTREYPVQNPVRVVDGRAVALLAVQPPNGARGIDLVGPEGERESNASSSWQTLQGGGRRLSVGSGPLQRILWYDAAGRLQRVDMPEQDVSARRLSPQ